MQLFFRRGATAAIVLFAAAANSFGPSTPLSAAQSVRVPSIFEGDVRTEKSLPLPGLGPRLPQALAEIENVSTIKLSALPIFDGPPVAIAGSRFHALECLVALSVATGGVWTRSGTGYRLEYRGKPVVSSLKMERNPDLDKDPDLLKKISWPPKTSPPSSPPPDVRPPDGQAGVPGVAGAAGERRFPGEPQPETEFANNSFGAALKQLAAQTGTCVVAQGEALSQTYRYRAKEGPTGAEVLRALAVQSDGTWQKMGHTYVLVRTPEELAFQYLPGSKKKKLMGAASRTLFLSLSPEQLKKLRARERIPFTSLTPEQQANFRAAALYHHSITPFYVLGDITAGCLTGLPSGAAITVGTEWVDILIWDWMKSR